MWFHWPHVKYAMAMSMGKKLALLIATAALLGGGVFYYLNSKDHYDPTQYSATITKAPAAPSSPPEATEPGPASAAAPAPAPAATGLAKGTKVELTLPDQFDKTHSISADTKTLILAFSKGSGGTVRGYLDKQSPSFLSEHKAIFIADISPIPVFIRNGMALPKLRKSSYPVLLVYEEAMAEALKNKEHGDEIAIATLDNNIVQGITYVAGEAELAAGIP